MTDEARQMGRPAIFRHKNAKNIHGMITKEGEQAFEQARSAVALLVKRPKKRVSDGDVVEFLARGFVLVVSRKACEQVLRRYIKDGSLTK